VNSIVFVFIMAFCCLLFCSNEDTRLILLRRNVREDVVAQKSSLLGWKTAIELFLKTPASFWGKATKPAQNFQMIPPKRSFVVVSFMFHVSSSCCWAVSVVCSFIFTSSLSWKREKRRSTVFYAYRRLLASSVIANGK
jgi:hypothetical protein